MTGGSDATGAGHRRIDVVRLVEWLATSDVTYFKLRVGETELTFSRGEPPAAQTSRRPAGEGREIDGPATWPVAQPPPAPADGRPADRAGEAAVRAPMVGIFHHAPVPGAPPYVVPGGRVKETSTVGLVESMKVFTAVMAGVAGTVVEVVAGNGEPVELGQVLVTVEPDGS
jgi:acetyl-CoA carboxylase biotin carboxyl carrier protein